MLLAVGGLASAAPCRQKHFIKTLQLRSTKISPSFHSSPASPCLCTLAISSGITVSKKPTRNPAALSLQANFKGLFYYINVTKPVERVMANTSLLRCGLWWDSTIRIFRVLWKGELSATWVRKLRMKMCDHIQRSTQLTSCIYNEYLYYMLEELSPLQSYWGFDPGATYLTRFYFSKFSWLRVESMHCCWFFMKFIFRATHNIVSPFNNQTLRFKSGAIAVKNRLPFQGQTTPDGNSLLLSLFLWPGRL